MLSFPSRCGAVLTVAVLLFLPVRGAELVVPEQVAFERGVEFARPGGVSLTLNLAQPKGATGLLPAVVCIHGGGFRAGSREGYDKLCLTLAARGYVAVTITYRLAPANRFPAAVEDCKAAVRWVRANAARLHVDPARIAVLGGSAGGHLAQFLGVTAGVPEFEGTENPGFSSAVAAVVNYYGTSDVTKSYGRSVDAAEVLPLFFGGDLSTHRAAHVRGSPLNWVTPHAAPTLILHGTEDKYVNYEQGLWMRDRLQQCGVDVELFTLKGAGHGFKGADAEKAEAAALAWLDRHFKRAGQ
ncbi:MAG: alpha/beta hydrolase [Opitutus sp.]|nr:alpha/beta hydrolase [Opitutus sp.]